MIWPHRPAGWLFSPEVCSVGSATNRRQLSFGSFFIEPRFLNEKQPQKPHNKLKKAQMTLRENKLNLELKLGGESDNPTSKGIP